MRHKVGFGSKALADLASMSHRSAAISTVTMSHIHPASDAIHANDEIMLWTTWVLDTA